MIPVMVTIAYPDHAPAAAEVHRWSRELVGARGVDGLSHVTLRSVNDLGALAVLFVDQSDDAVAPVGEALARLRQLAPGCAVSVDRAGPTVTTTIPISPHHHPQKVQEEQP